MFAQNGVILNRHRPPVNFAVVILRQVAHVDVDVPGDDTPRRLVVFVGELPRHARKLSASS